MAALQPYNTSTSNQTDLSRREFMRVLGGGLVIAVTVEASSAQVRPGGGQRGRGGGRGRDGAKTVAARLHLGKDGLITVMTGKVECGQGARAELTQAAAEELRISVDQVRLVMADTALVPDDGGTSGSQSTPSTVPAVRRGCVVARGLLAAFAAQQWKIDSKAVKVRDGKAIDAASGRTLAYADLAADVDAVKAVEAAAIPSNVSLTAVSQWKVLGTSVPRPNGRDIVTGSHRYPSDISRPGMLYGKVLRPPSFGAKLITVDLGPVKAMKGVAAVQDKEFVGIAAVTAFAAQQALDAIADTAKWTESTHPSSNDLYTHLRERVRGAIPKNPFAAEISNATKSLAATFHVAYVQHAPLEPRAAVAEWSNDKLTVWTGTQQPFGVKGELARVLGVAAENVRVIVPDFGGGFGGKHSGECAVEAARLARSVGKPVSLRWTREEEFTWAYFRPAGVIDIAATLDANGALTSWDFTNINSGGNEVQTPYRTGKSQARFVPSEPPLRHGSYRALAVTANTFARESFMDELAWAAGRDPLEFRLAHLDDERLRAVLQEAAKGFEWAARSKKKDADVGVGLACGTDKGSFVAACAEVLIDRKQGAVCVRHVCEAYECGKIVNPDNLRRQVTGAVTMGIGPALREEIKFDGGKVLNAKFSKYKVPRFEDVPSFDIRLIDRPDLPSAGAGETPIIAIAPAIANAVYAAIGLRIREMPIRLPVPHKVP